MQSSAWKDLPSELLITIAAKLEQAGVMLAVCTGWRSGLEAASHLAIKGSELPLRLWSRFSRLSSLDLQACSLVTPMRLSALRHLGSLTSLSLNMGPSDFTEAVFAALRGLRLQKLDLGSGSLREDSTNNMIQMLEGLPIVSLDLSRSKVTPVALASLRGMPLTSLKLPYGCSEVELKVIWDMPLQSLTFGAGQHWSRALLIKLRDLP